MTALNVALLSHLSRNANLGVGALSVCDVEILRGAGRDLGVPLRFTVIDSAGPRPSVLKGEDIDFRPVRTLREPHKALAILRRADLAVDICGGDSFADIYGPKRLRTMMMLQGMALASRTPLVFAPQTIGPFERPASRRLARAILNRAAVVATRDALSTKALRDLGVEGGIEASDVALRLPFEAPPPRADGARPRVGINPSGLLAAGGYTGKGELGLSGEAYRGMLKGIVDGLQALPEAPEVHLVPHVVPGDGGVEDDARACRELAALCPGAVVAPEFDTPSEAKGYIAGMDFFAGARMHACIAAFSSGVPVVPMAYSRKFAGLFGTLGYDRTVDCRTEGAEAITAAVLRGFADRAALAAEAAAALDRGRAKLGAYEDALRALIASVARRRAERG